MKHRERIHIFYLNIFVCKTWIQIEFPWRFSLSIERAIEFSIYVPFLRKQSEKYTIKIYLIVTSFCWKTSIQAFGLLTFNGYPKILHKSYLIFQETFGQNGSCGYHIRKLNFAILTLNHQISLKDSVFWFSGFKNELTTIFVFGFCSFLKIYP